MEKKEQNINSLLLKVRKEFKETQDLMNEHFKKTQALINSENFKKAQTLINQERSLILDLRSKLELNKKKEKRL